MLVVGIHILYTHYVYYTSTTCIQCVVVEEVFTPCPYINFLIDVSWQEAIVSVWMFIKVLTKVVCRLKIL